MTTNLYSDRIVERERAASEYRVFAGVPPINMADWNTALEFRDPHKGKDWPKSIARLAAPKSWPSHAFGTANAGVLLLWHRPGLSGKVGSPPPGAFIGPHTPVLGGVSHAHNIVWPKRHPSSSWTSISKFLPQALDTLVNPWSQVMIACLNPVPGAIGKVDKTANKEAVECDGRLDRIVSLCRPLILLACGIPVQEALTNWMNPRDTRVLRATHPLKWNGHGGDYDGPEVAGNLRKALNGE